MLRLGRVQSVLVQNLILRLWIIIINEAKRRLTKSSRLLWLYSLVIINFILRKS